MISSPLSTFAADVPGEKGFMSIYSWLQPRLWYAPISEPCGPWPSGDEAESSEGSMPCGINSC
jgi:hypothetical protein